MKEAGQERLDERVFVFKRGGVANGLSCKSAWRVAIRRIRCARRSSPHTGKRRALEDVQEAAGHRDRSTTKLYDRRGYNREKAASFFATY
jgi:hypothetical protein